MSGEVQLQFSLVDTSDPSAPPQEILQKLASLITLSPDDDDAIDEREGGDLLKSESRDLEDHEDDEENDDKSPETSDETDDLTKSEKSEKRNKKLRLKRLKKKAKARAYEFTGSGNVVGVIFLEIGKITDLPPERNSNTPQA